MPQTITPNLIAATRASWSPRRMLANAFEWFITIGDRTARGRAVNALAKLSDEELAARGTSRINEARRIMGPHWYM